MSKIRHESVSFVADVIFLCDLTLDGVANYNANGNTLLGAGTRP